MSNDKKEDQLVIDRTVSTTTESTNIETQNAEKEKEKQLEQHQKLQSKILLRKTNPIIRFLFRSKATPLVQNEKEYPLLSANILSFLTFHWVSDIINIGYSRRIENEDLYQISGTELSVETMTERFENILSEMTQKHYEQHPDEAYGSYLIFKAISKTFYKRFWLAGGISKVIADSTQITMPLMVRALIKYINTKDLEGTKDMGKAVGFPIGIACMLIFASLMISIFFHSSMLVGAQTKGVLTNVIYKKAFRLSARAKIQYPNSTINMMTMTDLARIDFALGTFHFMWAFPIAFSIATIILAVNLGAPCVVAVGTVLIYVVCVMWCNRKLKTLRRKSNVFIGKRVHAITEIINNLRMIKFYSWETPYQDNVKAYRSTEKKYILKMQIIKSLLNAGTATVTIIGTMFVFLWLHYDKATSKRFTSYNVFSAITLFNLLRMPLNLLPISVALNTDAQIALDKVALFLQAEESTQTLQRLPLNESSSAIEITNSTFQWDSSEPERVLDFKPKTKFWERLRLKKAKKQEAIATAAAKSATATAAASIEDDAEDLTFPGLKNIDLKVKKGELIVITGSIGTGKTSLLNAIDGSMKQLDGDTRVYGSLTFCSYPWVQNATIRENVLFGCEWNEKKYNEIVAACALDVDFANLPEGDQTEVGERGITLSGGQKARINLARAVYADRDIILLDDVLSAVDARVGKHIMTECINGILSSKTRLLATHQLSLIDSADRVVILDGSGSIDVGTADELLSRSAAFANLMEFSKYASDEESTAEEEEREEEEELELERQRTEISRIRTQRQEDHEAGEGERGSDDEEKTAGEDKSESRDFHISTLNLYLKYLLLGSGKLHHGIIPVFGICVALAGFIQVFSSVWLTYWLEDKFKFKDSSYTAVYVVVCVVSFFVFLMLYSLLAYVNNLAGLNLFNMSSARLLKSPMWFMDITPIGRILNRFTKDVDTIDTNLIEQLRLLITTIALIVATVILAGCYIPWFLIVIPFAVMLYYCFFVYYLPSALDLKTLEAVNRSFVFSHFNESLSGMKVVKSYDSTERFLLHFEGLIDKMNSAYYLTLSNQRWLSTRLDFISAMMTLLLSLLCTFGVFDISSSASGLLVSYIVQVSSSMSLLMRSMTQVENDMNSAERLLEYSLALPEEAQHESTEVKPEPSWPQQGAIEFENASLAYRAGLPLVLKNVSFSVGAGEKIGICGRTGAGKSTIMNALFRISELASGKVSIDGVDISELGLNDLRSKLSIIPQDPVLFNGTIRQNLDPFSKSTDSELWDALKRAWLVEDDAVGVQEYAQGDSLKSFHKFHLDQMVEDDGANFSLGERQLLALARALVRNSKILILDEATSSVDYETDAKIQSTIVNEFAACSILCIAHRLKTILNYDKILVLDKGEVMEFDTPYNLFKLGGIFSEMCDRSKITEADFIALE